MPATLADMKINRIPPPKCVGRVYYSDLMDSFRSLKRIGDTTDVNISDRHKIFLYAKRLKIKVTSRQLGRADKVTVWRVE